MAPPNRAKRKPKGGMAATTKPDNPATVNPAAANDTAVAIGGAAKRSHLEHHTPANATANKTTEPNPPATVAVHPATANGAYVPSVGDMATTVGSSDSIKYGNLTILSSLLLPPPVAAEAPLLSLNLLDGKTSASNTTVDGEITRIAEHAANITGSVETTMDTAINAGGATTNPLSPDSDTPQKLNNTSTTKNLPIKHKYSNRKYKINILLDYTSICKTKLTLHNPNF
jgi:hypothetical protein